MNESIEQRVVAIIAKEKGLDPGSISAETAMEDLGLDSLDGMSIIFELESAFEIEIPDDAAENARTVGDLIEGVRALVAEKS